MVFWFFSTTTTWSESLPSSSEPAAAEVERGAATIEPETWGAGATAETCACGCWTAETWAAAEVVVGVLMTMVGLTTMVAVRTQVARPCESQRYP